MADFKNTHSDTGRFTFNEQKFQFNNIFSTQDESLIAHLSALNHWKRIDQPDAPLPQASEDPDSTNEPTVEDLRKEADVLKINYHHLAGVKKLQELIEAKKAELNE